MIDQIAPNQLAQWGNQHADAGTLLVLDVREPWELQTACIKAAGFDFLHIPMSLVPARLQELDRNRPVACLCHHGGRSMQVAMFLERQGYATLFNLQGGIDAWACEVDPNLPRY